MPWCIQAKIRVKSQNRFVDPVNQETERWIPTRLPVCFESLVLPHTGNFLSPVVDITPYIPLHSQWW